MLWDECSSTRTAGPGQLTLMTWENVETRVGNLNRRFESRGSSIRYELQGRNGSVALDRYHTDGRCLSTVTVGTKREVGDFLHAAMVALDDAAYQDQTPVLDPHPNATRQARGRRAVEDAYPTEEFETGASDLMADILHAVLEDSGRPGYSNPPDGLESAEDILTSALRTYHGDFEDEPPREDS
jgi:hypothetical protein